MSQRFGEVCRHGSLRRQCEICDLDSLVAELRADIARLRGGLQWYAEGKHYIFDPDWEEEEGWLCPPSDDSFMVEPGRVAQAILDGRAINPDEDGELITIENNKSGA